MGEKENAYRLLVGEPEGRRPLERPRCRRVDNIKMYLAEMEWGGMGWVSVAQEGDWRKALVNKVMNVQAP
jgi:hypothetical protein